MRMLPQGMMLSSLRVENMRPQGIMRIEFKPYGPVFSFTIDMVLGAARYSVAAPPIGDVQVLPRNGMANDAAAL